MSKHRKRRKRDPKERPRQSHPGGLPDPSRLQDDLIKRFGETDLLGEGGEGQDLLANPAGHVRQEVLHDLWKRRGEMTQEGAVDADSEAEKQAAEDGRLVASMEEHPEYHEFFEDPSRLDANGCTKDGVNPFAHISMHAIVEGQLTAGTPPEVREYLKRFQTAGLSRHEAVHRVALVVSEMIFDTLKNERPYDEARYLEGLRKQLKHVEKGRA
jgi:hypothetical protein